MNTIAEEAEARVLAMYPQYKFKKDDDFYLNKYQQIYAQVKQDRLIMFAPAMLRLFKQALQENLLEHTLHRQIEDLVKCVEGE